jgi:hypothetical protein
VPLLMITGLYLFLAGAVLWLLRAHVLSSSDELDDSDASVNGPP